MSFSSLGVADYSTQTRLEFSSGHVLRGIQRNDSVSPHLQWSFAKRGAWFVSAAWNRVDVLDVASDQDEVQFGAGVVFELPSLGDLTLSVRDYNILHTSEAFDYDWLDMRARLGLFDDWALVLGQTDNYWGRNERSTYYELNYATALTQHWLCNLAIGEQDTDGITEWPMRYGHINMAYAFNSNWFSSLEYRFVNSESQRALADFAGQGWYARLGYRF